LLRKDLRDLADFELLGQESNVAVKFDVMRGMLTNLCSADANDPIVWMQEFPSSSVQSQLQVFKQTSHVTQARRIAGWARYGLEVSNHHQTLGGTLLSVQRVGFRVVCAGENTAFLEQCSTLVGHDNNVHPVSVTKQVESTRGIVGNRVDSNGPLVLGRWRPFKGNRCSVDEPKVRFQQSGKSTLRWKFLCTLSML
jgi:hypothetical protein